MCIVPLRAVYSVASWTAEDLLFCSRMQHPALRTDASVVGPYLGVWVRGRPWWSVAVDVPIDVGRGASRSRALIICVYTAKHLILGQEFPGQAPRRGGALSRSCTLGLVGRLVDMAEPDHAATRGQPSTR